MIRHQVIAMADKWKKSAPQGELSQDEHLIASANTLPFIVSVKHDAGKVDRLHVLAPDSITALVQVLEMYWPGIPSEQRPSNLKIEVHPQL